MKISTNKPQNSMKKKERKKKTKNYKYGNVYKSKKTFNELPQSENLKAAGYTCNSIGKRNICMDILFKCMGGYVHVNKNIFVHRDWGVGAHFKSASLNSYGMFQPNGPNSRRSWTTAWKKTNAKTPRNQHLLADSINMNALVKNLSRTNGSELNDLCILALRPFGGSFVILTEFCNTDTGNTELGYEVHHKR